MDTLQKRVINSIKKGQKGYGLKLFMEDINDIKQSLDNGLTMKSIWNTLNKEKDDYIGYWMFANYCKRFITSNEDTPKEVDISQKGFINKPSKELRKNELVSDKGTKNDNQRNKATKKPRIDKPEEPFIRDPSEGYDNLF